MITQQELKQILSYDKDTGIFTWSKLPKFSYAKVGNVAGSLYNNGYVYIKIKSKRYKAHILAFLYEYGYLPNCSIDHINRNKKDNRIANLRICNASENAQNRDVKNTKNNAGYFGVLINKNSKKNPYVASIKYNYKKYYLGSFDNPIDAHNAYLKAKKELHKFYVEN